MTVNTPEPVILHCIIEEKVFYYGLMKGTHIVQADGIRINSDFNFFQSPQVILDFLKRSIDISTISEAYLAIANTNYSLIPDEVSDEDTIHWITHTTSSAHNFHIDQLRGLKVGYHISTSLETTLSNTLPIRKIHHVISTNLNGDDKQNGVYAYPINGLQFIQLVENTKTIYGNLVPSNSLLSRLYFTLLPYHLHKKDTMSLPLYTTEWPPNQVTELKTYIKEVDMLQTTLSVTSDSPLSTEQVYQIEKLAQCAS